MTIKVELRNTNGESIQSQKATSNEVINFTTIKGELVAAFGKQFIGEIIKSAGEVYLFEQDGKTRLEGKTANGVKLRKDLMFGKALLPGQELIFNPQPGEEIEIKIAADATHEAQMFDSLGPILEGQTVALIGLSLES